MMTPAPGPPAGRFRILEERHMRRNKMESEKEWAELVKIEPGLADLINDIDRVHDDGSTTSFCANAVWYGEGPHQGKGFKSRFTKLVRFNARSRDPRIRTMHAYSFAYSYCYDRLPGCRNCWCY
jgi:hypothetical protein